MLDGHSADIRQSAIGIRHSFDDHAAIEMRDLHREYAGGRGVRGVTLTVRAGECFALLGRNGSGKSTLNRLLLGLERPDRGEAVVLGCAVHRGERGHLRRIGVALETAAHWEMLSGWDNARFFAASYGLPRAEADRRLTELFEASGLAGQAKCPVATYSFGMRRKLALVQALCHEPELLMLDEPTAAVDAHFQVWLAEAIRARGRAGRTTWITGNEAEFMAGVADRVAFLEAGRVPAQGTVRELVAKVLPLRELRLTLTSVAPLPAPALPGVRSWRQEGAEITVLLEADDSLLPRVIEWAAAQGAPVQSAEMRRSTLRDAHLMACGTVHV